jgi:hypothetical protein
VSNFFEHFLNPKKLCIQTFLFKFKFCSVSKFIPIQIFFKCDFQLGSNFKNFEKMIPNLFVEMMNCMYARMRVNIILDWFQIQCITHEQDGPNPTRTPMHVLRIKVHQTSDA